MKCPQVPEPHQVPERPCHSPLPSCPPPQPLCYTEPTQSNCPPEMLFTKNHLKDMGPTFTANNIPKNCYCSPTQQTTVPSTGDEVFMSSKYACPQDLLPKEPLPQKEPDHYKGMPAYCSYLEKGKATDVLEEPTKGREILYTSRLKEEKYCPKKPCICIPSLESKPVINTTENKTSEQKCSSSTTNQYYFPAENKVLEQGKYSEELSREPCSPYEGSEKWGPNAFKRPNFMSIEDQAQKFYGTNKATCLQQCHGNTSPQSHRPLQYRSEVCDEVAKLENERAQKLYKDYPQHENCRVISRKLPEQYPEVLCYEEHQKSASNKEKICSHSNFTPGIHAIQDLDRAKHCPKGKPDCNCPVPELRVSIVRKL